MILALIRSRPERLRKPAIFQWADVPPEKFNPARQHWLFPANLTFPHKTTA
jgi:hypothetical protein